jgi:hypothetical protein
VVSSLQFIVADWRVALYQVFPEIRDSRPLMAFGTTMNPVWSENWIELKLRHICGFIADNELTRWPEYWIRSDLF